MPNLKSYHPYAIAAIGFVLAFALFAWLGISAKTYAPLRGSLFTGFFTVAGFLLSAKALVILNMKKEVYEKEYYLKKLHDEHWSRIEVRSKHERTPRINCVPHPVVYGPLSQIGTVLTANIVLSLLTSFSQITIGLSEHRFATVFCLAMVAATTCLLACSVYLMWRNFGALYKVWESQAQETLDKQWEESMEAFHASLPATAEQEDLPIQPTHGLGEERPREGRRDQP